MKQKQYSFIILALFLILSSGCLPTKQLRFHRLSLQNLVAAPISSAEKFDSFAQVMADVLDEATSLNSPVKTYRYLNKFSKQNDRELDLLLKDLEPWQANMSLGQKAKFAKNSLTKPYGRKLVRLIPKVTKMMANGDYKLGKLESALLLFKLKKVLK